MFHSFKQFPRYVTGGCCLFLAGKVEETPKKCKDIIKTARSLLNDIQFAQFGDDPKEEVMVLERILLQTIKFDLQVEHPYQFLLRYAKQLKGDKNKVQKLVQMAWTFVNDSLCTMVALQWEPQIIAVAVLYLAGRLSKLDIQEWTSKQSSRRWWEQFVHDVPVEVLEDICHQILDLYSQAKQPIPDGGIGTAETPPQLSPLSPPAPPQAKKASPQTSPRLPRPAQHSPKDDSKPKLSNLEPLPPPPPPPPPVSINPDHKPPSSYLPASDLSSRPPPPPLPHCPPPPPPLPMDLPTSSSLVSSEGYQKLQSMMRTEASCYTTAPPACAPPLGFHHYPPGTTPFHPPPLSAYSYLLAPPPSVIGMAHILNSGYPPLPTTAGHNQLAPPLPPGMPPVSGLSRGTWMR
ncbi:LOW QUALITY PROTEIN: cyclin-K-like [Eleginops maclovinus]|uniref:LOW QUALITY PROTEIN: cyclin-K-like n=1 Tax=Eleginops maclovinus TaxID=56733 RepID=UPI0030804B75